MIMKIQIISVPGVRWGWGVGNRILGETDVWKNGEHVPAFSNSGVYKFLEWVPMCSLSPLWVGACPGKENFIAYTQSHPTSVPSCGGNSQNSRSCSHGKKEGNHTPLHQSQSLINTLVCLAYLVPEDQSALQQVRVEERGANLWCLQLQREIEEQRETWESYNSRIQVTPLYKIMS